MERTTMRTIAETISSTALATTFPYLGTVYTTPY